VRHRRLPIGYRLNDRAQRGKVLPELAGKIKNALESLFWVEHNGVADTIAKLDIYCLTFLKQYGEDNEIVPPATNK